MDKEQKSKKVKAAAAPKVLAAIEKFRPRVQRLSAAAGGLFDETRTLARALVKFLKPAANEAGKKLVGHVLKACDAEATVLLYTVRFAACVIAENAKHGIGTLRRKPEGATEYQDVPATVAEIATVSELVECSKVANRALGVKPRGRRQGTSTKAEAKTFGWPDVLAAIADRMKAFPISTAGELAKTLEPFGYRVVEVEQPAEQQQAAPAAAASPRARVRRAA